MWIGGDTPIELQRNATVSIGIEIQELTNGKYNFVNLSGTVLKCDVSESGGSTVIAKPSIQYDDLSKGQFSIRFSGSAFNAVKGYKEIVILSYNVRVFDGPNKEVIMRGPLILIPGVGE